MMNAPFATYSPDSGVLLTCSGRTQKQSPDDWPDFQTDE